MKLDVYCNNKLAGTLEQVDLTRYVFSYAPHASQDVMVSLLMPVRTESWVHRFLHPVFQVSLPEGALRQVLTQKFAKRFDRFGETELLATIGAHLVGRLKVVPHGIYPKSDSPQESLKQLLKESPQEILEHYLERHAEFSGVSGGFTKFLTKSSLSSNQDSSEHSLSGRLAKGFSKSLNDSPSNSLSPFHYSSPLLDEDIKKSTLTFDHWIVKGNSTDHPDLVLNEYFGLLLAKRMNLSVPTVHLSDDAQRIAIERFDIGVDQERYGFEDMCALHGINASDKFSGSVERVVKTINSFCAPAQAEKDRFNFYAQYVAAMAIRNGDAHLKNFGLLYTNRQDARLSPVYDMVSMSVYAPAAKNGDALDEPAMSLDGIRRWPTEKTLKYLAARCMVSPTRQAQVKDLLIQAMMDTAQDIVQMACDRSEFEPVAKRMLELWACGLELHSPEHAEQLRALAEDIHNEKSAYEERPQMRL